MSIELFALDLVVENPWNERPLDAENVAQIAASLLTDGLLQTPVGRPHPTKPGHVQLAYGHHRAAAFRQLAAAHPTDQRWQLLPVDLREIDDLRMARYAIIENHSRKDPSAIEKARALLRLTSEFKQTHAQAGEVFGLKNQASVANLLRLLKLPEEVQALVDAGQLPESLARQLVSLSRVMPKEAAKIAAAAAKADPHERHVEFENAFNETVRNRGRWLSNTAWPQGWPEQPIALTGHKSLTEIPSCDGCEFSVRSRFHGPACIRPECYAAKEVEHARTKAAAAAKKLGLAVGAPGEKVVDLISSADADLALVQRALKANHPSLRVVPAPTDSYYTRNTRARVTGDGQLTIATVDRTALVAAFPPPKPREASKSANGTGAGAKPAEPHVMSERDSKWAMRRKHGEALLAAAAPHIAEALPADNRALNLLWTVFGHNYIDPKFRQAWAKATTPAGRRVVLAHWLLNEMDETTDWESLDDMHAGVVKLAAEVKVKLPADWDPTAKKAEPAPKPAKDVRGHTRPTPTQSPRSPAGKPSTKKQPAPAKPVGVSTGRPSRAAQQRAQAAAASAKKGGRK
ncbi:MAG: ParB/RepB/Spo0J family partition protein [Anaerolineales bacterium]|nr:ParB/RepB/Spo0J family partition protein [Anaerolineales bacterium]